ncbi:MAG: glutamate-1-semialdehyde 2,1-aminomutase [Cyclobacteriaceae bacterium]|nr:glutamate-1-semialdehyde 2,1-aminomutase [Cyclobacteriaceae bacterium]
MEKIRYTKSQQLFERAQQHIPGGVNSPVRAFRSVGGSPVFIKKAKGAYLFDEDGNRYIDYINSWGPMILGHAYQPVVDAICAKVADSTSFGAPTELEIQMAELIKSMVPNVDLIRMVNSGTEACMSAVRLARGYTGRNKIIMFEGCYHGHADSFLVKAGSGIATLGIQSVPGVSKALANDTLTAPYNNLNAVESLIAQHPDEIAAIIIEPVAGNMGCIIPMKGYLDGLRGLCDKHNIVLIFDEVMTGFRLAPGGAQQLYNIRADLVTYGKIIGGGLPVGAFAGRKEIMQHIAPMGSVYQAGTLSGNPIAMIAGYTLLKELKENSFHYKELEAKTKKLSGAIRKLLAEKGIAHTINQLGSMMSVHFGSHPVTDFESAKACNKDLFNKFFHHMLNHGVYLPPSAFESWFISSTLSEEDIDQTLSAIENFPS